MRELIPTANRWVRPHKEGERSPAVLLLGEPATGGLDRLVDLLTGVGFWVAPLRTAGVSDPAAIADLADWLAEARVLPGADGRVFLCGVGGGATAVFLALGAIPGFSGAVGFFGAILYSSLDDAHPVHPLDLLFGSSVPLQCHFAEEDPHTPRAHIATLRERLGRGVVHQVFVLPGTSSGFFERDSVDVQASLVRARRFFERISRDLQ